MLEKEENFRIVQLPPTKVFSFQAMGEKIGEPEKRAWDKMEKWAKPKGLFNDPEKHQIYGFNNPNPSKDSDIYGYEFWVTIDNSIEVDEKIEMKEFPGGLYAARRCKLKNIGEAWKNLAKAVKESDKYTADFKRQWLEHHTDPNITDFENLIIDLYH
ncbi:MAG: effector binding domain-containing protein, partial [Candidatus Heimdallarchaeaceae archaeon]